MVSTASAVAGEFKHKKQPSIAALAVHTLQLCCLLQFPLVAAARAAAVTGVVLLQRS
jgi:hypothetical protein